MSDSNSTTLDQAIFQMSRIWHYQHYTQACEGTGLPNWLSHMQTSIANFLSSLSFPSSHRIEKGLFSHQSVGKVHLLQHPLFLCNEGLGNLAVWKHSWCKMHEVISKQKWEIIFRDKICKQNLSSCHRLMGVLLLTIYWCLLVARCIFTSFTPRWPILISVPQ